MTAKSNVIELNGRSYDALTGAMLGTAKRPEHRVHVAAVPAKQPPRSSMDGFVHHTQPKPTKQLHAKQPASHVTAHQPQPTKTLMRRAVKAPQLSPASHKNVGGIRSLAPLKPGAPAKTIASPKFSSNVVDPMRLRRAASADRSNLVKHFTASKPVAAPASLQTLRAATQPSQQGPQRPTYNSNPALSSAMSNTSRTAQPAQKTVAKQSNKYEDQDIFEQALAHATSHQERAPKESKAKSAKREGKKHRRVLGFAAATLAFVLMCSFVAYQNKANIQLQLASAKAGFSASAPLYKPAGYSLDKLAYSPGSVAMAYQDNSTNNSFKVTQKKSNWDSQTLLDSFVATSNQPYQGYESAGRTIYVYGQGKATWVNGGVWYQIDGANNLTNDQIVKVAASM